MLKARHTQLQNAYDEGTFIAPAQDGFDEEEAARTTIQIVLFDGEEAYKTWTDTDSTYGSRFVHSRFDECGKDIRINSYNTIGPHRHLAELW